MVVPSSAIQSGSQGSFVWVVKPDHTVAMEPVQVELAEGQTTILEGGATAGQEVVVDGADRLQQGAQVILTATRAVQGLEPGIRP